tara:strand:+ start:3176 stop:3550 length:375 start_codon:yes stop_codon:yes gene_type:complete
MSKKLKIVSKQDGFRRAGFAFGSEETILDPADLSKTQIKQLKTETMLVVTEIEDSGKSAKATQNEPDTKTAEEVITEIEASEDLKFLGSQLKDKRVTVQRAAKARIESLENTEASKTGNNTDKK